MAQGADRLSRQHDDGAAMNGMSDESWRTAIVCSHLRRDVEEIERLFTSVGPFLPDRIDHMRQSVERLRKIIDAHVLPELQMGVHGNQERPELALDVHPAQAD
jgi:hypothetical protein